LVSTVATSLEEDGWPFEDPRGSRVVEAFS
jgi:hypothetical protein